MADFHSKMSVCRHQLGRGGGSTPQPPRQFQPWETLNLAQSMQAALQHGPSTRLFRGVWSYQRIYAAYIFSGPMLLLQCIPGPVSSTEGEGISIPLTHQMCHDQHVCVPVIFKLQGTSNIMSTNMPTRRPILVRFIVQCKKTDI